MYYPRGSRGRRIPRAPWVRRKGCGGEERKVSGTTKGALDSGVTTHLQKRAKSSRFDTSSIRAFSFGFSVRVTRRTRRMTGREIYDGAKEEGRRPSTR